MRPRFYLPGIASGVDGVLDDEEGRHLTRVLRLGVGDEIEVTDGRGGMFRGEVLEVARSGVRIRVAEPVPAASEARARVTLVMSVLKGDKMDDVVRDAVMMGVVAVQPVVAGRSETSLATLGRGHRRDRWQRVAVAGLKQCGRAVLPEVRPPLDLGTWMEQGSDNLVIVLTEPSVGSAGGLRDIPRAGAVSLLVGPEGGWAPEETARFRAAGYRAVALGGRTLRADAAPLVALAALYEAWEGW